MISKKSLRKKRRKCVANKKLIDTLRGSNKKNMLNMFHQKINILVDDYEVAIYDQPPRNKSSNTLKLLKK